MTVRFTAGTRVRLVSTDDEHTHLIAGDEGTVHSMSAQPGGVEVLNVNWDSGSTLSLILGVDEFEVVSS